MRKKVANTASSLGPTLATYLPRTHQPCASRKSLTSSPNMTNCSASISRSTQPCFLYTGLTIIVIMWFSMTIQKYLPPMIFSKRTRMISSRWILNAAWNRLTAVICQIWQDLVWGRRQRLLCFCHYFWSCLVDLLLYNRVIKRVPNLK